MDNRSSSSWIFDILNSNRDLTADHLWSSRKKKKKFFILDLFMVEKKISNSYLLHRERVYDLTSIIG